MRGDDQINQELQMLRNKQLFTHRIARTNTTRTDETFACTCLCDVILSVREVFLLL